MASARGHAYPACMATFSLNEELESYAAMARRIEELLRGDAAALVRVNATVSAWSPLQQAAHVTLANELVLKNLGNLAKGSGMLVVFEAEQNPRALEILSRGTLPRGEAQAPRMVVPPRDVDVATTHEWAAKFTADLDAFRSSVDAEKLPRCFIPHQVLGPLDVGQWARFGVAHSRHHLSIAREALGGG
jgi:hypothetical protein